jgi:hypothetical protein
LPAFSSTGQTSANGTPPSGRRNWYFSDVRSTDGVMPLTITLAPPQAMLRPSAEKATLHTGP